MFIISWKIGVDSCSSLTSSISNLFTNALLNHHYWRKYNKNHPRWIMHIPLTLSCHPPQIWTTPIPSSIYPPHSLHHSNNTIISPCKPWIANQSHKLHLPLQILDMPHLLTWLKEVQKNGPHNATTILLDGIKRMCLVPIPPEYHQHWCECKCKYTTIDLGSSSDNSENMLFVNMHNGEDNMHT